MRYIIVLLLFFPVKLLTQVGINTTNPSPASVLDISSSGNGIDFGGFLIPRVTIAQRDLIPALNYDDGLMIYLIDGNNRCIQIWDGVNLLWENVYCMPINQAPVANNVIINGNFIENETLTAIFDYSDADGDSEGAHLYNWYTADDNLGTNQTLIQSGVLNTLTLTNSFINSYIAVEITPVATTGTSPGTPVLSEYLGPILAVSSGGIFISEIGDPDNNPNARFVEITNGSANPIDLTNWQLFLYSNNNTTPTTTFNFPSTTIINGGASYVVAQNGPEFSLVYGFSANGLNALMNSNGDDNFELRDNNNILIDIYGVVGIDQTGFCAEFEDGRALRINTIIEGNPIWDESEWIIRADSTINGCTNHANAVQNAPTNFTPGIHPN